MSHSLTTRLLSGEVYDALEAAHPPASPVRVDELGAGDPPLVFLHGLLGLNEHWRPMAGALCERARCIMIEAPLLELRGDLCSVDGVTSLITATIERVLDGQPAVLVGNSLGGHVAQKIALDRPELVRGLVLAGSSGLFERTLEKNVQHRPSREWLEKKINDLFYDKSKVPHNCVDLAFEELSKRHGARAMVKLGKSAKNDYMGARLERLRVPTLLLWGRQDNVTPPMVAEEFHDLIEGSRLVWIDECGHAPMIECPERFAREVRLFLDDLEAGRFGENAPGAPGSPGAPGAPGASNDGDDEGRQEVA